MKTTTKKMWAVSCPCCDGLVTRQLDENDVPLVVVSDVREDVERIAKDLGTKVIEMTCIYQIK